MFVINLKCEIYKSALLFVIRLTRLWYMAIQVLFQLSNFTIQVSFIHCIFWTQPVEIIVKWPDQTVILFSCLPGNSCLRSMMFSWLACASNSEHNRTALLFTVLDNQLFSCHLSIYLTTFEYLGYYAPSCICW